MSAGMLASVVGGLLSPVLACAPVPLAIVVWPLGVIPLGRVRRVWLSVRVAVPRIGGTAVLPRVRRMRMRMHVRHGRERLLAVPVRLQGWEECRDRRMIASGCGRLVRHGCR